MKKNITLTYIPHNFEIEQALLGLLLHRNNLLEDVVDFLHEDHFHDPLHGDIYKTIKHYVENNRLADFHTLQQYFQDHDKISSKKQSSYLADLSKCIVSLSNALDYGEQIYDLYLRRQLVFLGQQLVEEASTASLDKKAKDTLEMVERNLFSLAEKGKREGSVKHLKEILVHTLDTAQKAFQKNTHIVGLSSGINGLDEMLGGFHPSDLVIVAGRPGMGKTALATNIAFNASEKKTPILLFSLEMSAEQLALRVLSQNVNIPSDNIRKGKVSVDDFPRFVTKTRQLGEYPFYIDDTPFLNISALRTRARRAHRKYGIELIVVDYIQLVSSDRPGKENRVQELAEITRGLKGLAKELNVPVIALSQLSRAVEAREDKRPQLSDLRGSGSIEQDADVVMFVYREEYYKNLKKNDQDYKGRYSSIPGSSVPEDLAELIVAKQRNGPVGTVSLRFDKGLTRFSD